MADDIRPDLAALGQGASATFVYGASREIVGLCAWAMARANDPAPFWLDIRAENGRADPGSPPELGWINADQLFVLAAAQAKPQSAVGPKTIASIIRSDEPDSAVAELSDFLSLPSAVQEMIGLHAGGVGRPAFVIANGDRVRPYYPADTGGVRRILDVLLHQGVLPIFTSTPPPGAGRMAFDFVFEVRASDRTAREPGMLHCEKAPAGSTFRAGESSPLRDFSALADALDRRRVPASRDR